MEDLETARRRMLAGAGLLWVLAVVSGFGADPVMMLPRLRMGQVAGVVPQGETAAVAMADGKAWVTVMSGPGAGEASQVRVGDREVALEPIGHDAVSRLQFFKVVGGTGAKPMIWLDEVGVNDSAELSAVMAGGKQRCRTTGWAKQVGGKILPLSLLRVTFDRGVPAAGTPLVDGAGRVVALVFQAAETENTGFAIPAEAVHRVRKDVCNGGKLVKGWLGVSLKPGLQSPQVVRVLPGSPAAEAGVQPGDVLVRIDRRDLTEYADAANAFFYLVPGKVVSLRVLRGVETVDFQVVPVAAGG